MTRTLRALTFASVTALLLGGLAPALADDPQRDLDAVTSRIASLNDQISDATAKRSSLAAQIKATKTKMDDTVAALEVVRADIARVEAKVASVEGKVDKLSGLVTDLRIAIAAHHAKDLNP